MYEYLVWVALLGFFWFFMYFSRRDLRTKMLWSSLIALPFGFGELYFIPNYWVPQTLFNFGVKYGIDIEAFLLMFFLGGIAGFIYEGLSKKRVVMKKVCRPCKCYVPLITTLVAFIILTKSFASLNIIYSAVISCIIGGISAAILYPNLRKHIIYGGLLFAILYWVSLGASEFISPWILSTWNMSSLSGIMLLKVPIEEIIFGFAFGVLWTPLYEEICSNMK